MGRFAELPNRRGRAGAGPWQRGSGPPDSRQSPAGDREGPPSVLLYGTQSPCAMLGTIRGAVECVGVGPLGARRPGPDRGVEPQTRRGAAQGPRRGAVPGDRPAVGSSASASPPQDLRPAPLRRRAPVCFLRRPSAPFRPAPAPAVLPRPRARRGGYFGGGGAVGRTRHPDGPDAPQTSAVATEKGRHWEERRRRTDAGG